MHNKRYIPRNARVAYNLGWPGFTSTKKTLPRPLAKGLGGERAFEPPRLMLEINRGDRFY